MVVGGSTLFRKDNAATNGRPLRAVDLLPKNREQECTKLLKACWRTAVERRSAVRAEMTTEWVAALKELRTLFFTGSPKAGFRYDKVYDLDELLE